MKKIYSFAFAAVAILSAASCQKEELTNNETLLGGGNFTVTATIEADTKTVLVDDKDGNTIYWTPGDKISLFNKEGNAVTFGTNITANATTAEFTNEAEFDAPEKLLAIYPAKSTTFDGTKITELRIAGTQTAVAGSFDPAYAVAVGTEDASGNLQFTNINSLIKFTIGGDKAPKVVTFTNGGSRHIVGRYSYDLVSEPSTNTILPFNDGKTATLKPAEGASFEIGKTYYIAIIPGGNLASMSLKFDETEVKAVAGPKFADNTNNFFIGKIIDFGTVAFPDDEPELEEPVVSAIDVTRVWGHYGVDGKAWSNSVVASLDGADRSLAMDDKYIYIPETNTSGNIHKFNVADGTYAGTLPASADMNLGTHYVSCIRTVKNSNGDDILLVSNLSLGEGLRIFAYVNGADAEPVTMTTISSTRRWGDKFTVTGTWENGKMWFRSYDSRGMVGFVPLSGENTTWDWVEAHPVDNGNAIDANNISEVTWVPGTEGFCLLNTNSDFGAHVMSGTSGAYTEVKSYPTLAKTFGYNFFEVGDNKFIAWTSLVYGKESPRLQIVQSDATTVEKMVETFDNLSTRLVFEAPLQNADDMTVPGVGGGHTVCDCCVREINGELYIAAIAQKAGLSLFKVTAK